MRISEYLKEQVNYHPSMTPQDVVKLCYQAAFGAEHMIKNVDMTRKNLYAECEGLAEGAEEEPLYECISDINCRVNLRAWKKYNISLEILFNMFMESAIPLANSRFLMKEEKKTLFKEHLAEAEALMEQGVFGFDRVQWVQFIEQYPMDEPVAVHHSESYREAEKPAYRLVSRHYIKIFPILAALAKLPDDDVQIVAIDGKSGSGKTVLAKELAALTGAGVVHMDDFFLPQKLRTEERLAEVGGNIHYERILEEVIPKLQSPDGFTYGRFDCGKMEVVGQRKVATAKLRIVEGSYSCHPALGNYMSVRVFSDVDEKEQLRRIARRDGEDALKYFSECWIPMEEKYFAACDIKNKADVIIKS